ncbi:MAG: dTMP kinase [Gemmatimonas sp.]
MPTAIRRRGRFLTLEGGEGAGKSTQIKILATKLQELGEDVVTTREPGGSPGAEAIRALLVEHRNQGWTPLTEAFLHSAARAEHIAATVRPALARGAWVISDRYSDSTLAYQSYGLGVPKPTVAALTRLATAGLKPDLTLILDVPVTAGLARAGRRIAASSGPAEDRYERMGEAFHERLRRGFRAIARAEPKRCRIIDASGSIDEVAARIWAAVAKRFKLAP